MSCTKTQNIKLEPAYASWGKRQAVCLEADLTLAGGEYFLISNTTTDYAVWFEVDSVGTAPVLTGKTLIKVTLVASYTASQFQTALKSALTMCNVYPLSDLGYVKVEVKEKGAVHSAWNTGTFTGEFTVETIGLGGDLGKTDGGIEFKYESNLMEVKADQTGENLIDEILTGHKATVTMSLLEMTKEKWELILGGAMGDVLEPVSGTKLVGAGSSKLYNSMFGFAGELVIHPVSAGADKTRDMNIWKCVPMPESVNFSGKDLQKMSVTFKAYQDDSKNAKINLFAIGDGSQDILA